MSKKKKLSEQGTVNNMILSEQVKVINERLLGQVTVVEGKLSR